MAFADAAAAAASSATAPGAQPALVNASDVPNSNDIVVQARRRDEVIQDIPSTVQAVSGSALQKLDLFQFQDIGKVIPGVTLDKSETAITMRGVSFNVLQRTNPTVSTYLNEAPLQGTFLFQSMFDIGQVDALKGPQGTLRGQSAPTGALLLTTAPADLYRYGGYASGTITNQDGRTLQGALNIPVIAGKFALRFAGIIDHNNDGGVKSVNNPADPYSDTQAFRVTARVEPVDNLSIVVVYQHLFDKSLNYGVAGDPNAALFGNGAPGGTIKSSSYALPYVQVAGSNGPVIPLGENESVTENGNTGRGHQQILTGHVDFKFAGQKLSYVGGWSKTSNPECCSYGDKGNLLDGDYAGTNVANNLTRWTHELRLSSEQRIAGIFDYVIGVFHERETTSNDVDTGPVAFLPGAFGSPLGAPSATSPNTNYAIDVVSKLSSLNTEWSYFGNVVAHLGEKTELSGGVRFINSHQDNYRETDTSAAKVAIALPFACSLAGLSSSTLYPGVCETAVPASSTVTSDQSHAKPTVYSATLSHHFTPDLMTYFSFGTSWRPGPVQGGIVNGANDPVITALGKLKDETTKSFEVGFKTSILDKRLTFDFAYYHQNYKNLVIAGGTVPYLADTTGGNCVTISTCSVASQTSIVSNVNAKVDGIDADFSFAMSQRWHISGGISYSNGRYSNQPVPCNDGNFDGVPDTITPTVAGFLAAKEHIAVCNINGKASPTAPWNGTLQSEYSMPVSTKFDAFVNGLLTYTPKNPNLSGNPYVTPGYAIFDLHVGIRAPNGLWELEAFAKNLFNDHTILQEGFNDVSSNSLIGTFGSSGYKTVDYVLPREIGVTLRVAFGSR